MVTNTDLPREGWRCHQQKQANHRKWEVEADCAEAQSLGLTGSFACGLHRACHMLNEVNQPCRGSGKRLWDR